MLVFIAGVVLALLLTEVLWPKAFWTDRGQQLSGIQNYFTIAAIALGGYWYFFERPDAPKVQIDQTVSAVPLKERRALVLVETSLKNVGSSVLELKDAPLSIYVQQVTPLAPEVAKEVADDVRPGVMRGVHFADNWGSLAQTGAQDGSMSPAGRVTTRVEAGETENIYYRAVVDCSDDLRVSVSTRLDKPRTWYESGSDRPMQWIKQSYLDLTTVCAKRKKG